MKDYVIPILVIGILIGCAIGFPLGALVERKNNSEKWQQTCIKLGYAEYNSTNGVWQWKEQAK